MLGANVARRPSELRPDLQRKWEELDDALDRAVIIDKRGDAWQKSAYLGYWYRAYDGDGISSYQLAQNADGARFLYAGGDS